MPKKAARKPATKKVAKPKPSVKKVVRKVPAAKTKAKSVATKKKVAKSREPAAAESLGRPLITAEERLYLLFKEDYHARQIFEFLRVDTVGELEHYRPQQIIDILSTPIRNTVERIRQRLAENKRSLREDEAYALRFLSATQPKSK